MTAAATAIRIIVITATVTTVAGIEHGERSVVPPRTRSATRSQSLHAGR